MAWRAGGGVQRWWAALLWGTCVLLAGVVRADGWHVEYDAPVPLFLDRSYILDSPNRIRRQGAPNSPEKLIFEAQVAPNLFLPQLHHGDFTRPGGEYFLSLIITPAVQLRIVDTASDPAIPPSFIAKATFQVAHLRPLAKPRAEGAAVRGLALALNVIVAHYSNGESGCFYSNQTRGESGCTPSEGQLPLNGVSGSFTTNFFRMEFHSRLAFDVEPDLRNAWLLGGFAAFELNTSIGPGRITRSQRAVYGDGHWAAGVMGQRTWSNHRFPLEVSVSQPFGETPSQRATWKAEFGVYPRWGAGFGVFARYVKGQDYYNILFLEPVALWQFGLAFELNPGARLRAAEEGRPPGFP
ncbi:hypothetical protein [Myxococcus xanthus]|uniref:hypothetical protein n=1 Tax=Myxococcus xanthus TaxID=34 RepID=UPI00112BFE9B|nr:hypothetical protein [Myxococcus xanthus]QDE87069.1 hypothetical protein BHS07_13800 [Myxococcus xanthus]